MKKTGMYYVFENNIGGSDTVLCGAKAMFNCTVGLAREVKRSLRGYEGKKIDGELMRLRLVRQGVWKLVGRRLKRQSCLQLLEDQKDKMMDDSPIHRRTRKGLVVKSGKFFYVIWRDKRGRWYAA